MTDVQVTLAKHGLELQGSPVVSASKAADLSELEVNIKIEGLTSGAGAANAVEVAGVNGSDSVAITAVVI